MDLTKLMHVDHPDDERYDAINIRVVERWKESELSGDEWRFSYVADIMRKGHVVIQLSASKLDWLLKGLQWRILTAGEDEKIDSAAWDLTKTLCDQPGCKELPTVFYIRKKRYTKQGAELALSDFYDGKEYRQFCNRHKHRGDCGLDDADQNYILIEEGATNGN